MRTGKFVSKGYNAVSVMMRWIMHSIWVGIAVLCMPQVVLSQQERSVEEVLVVGARLPRPLADVVGTVDVLPRALVETFLA